MTRNDELLRLWMDSSGQGEVPAHNHYLASDLGVDKPWGGKFDSRHLHRIFLASDLVF
jgi:hypothetical protein